MPHPCTDQRDRLYLYQCKISPLGAKKTENRHLSTINAGSLSANSRFPRRYARYKLHYCYYYCGVQLFKKPDDIREASGIYFIGLVFAVVQKSILALGWGDRPHESATSIQ